MTLGVLLERVALLVPIELGAPLVDSLAQRQVSGVEYDSRAVTPGAIFVGMRGQKVDGASFAQQAVVKGALAVVSEALTPGLPVPWIRVADSHAALAAFAAVFYGHPSDDLLVVGITGTNGKTTTSYLTAAIFDAAGVRCGRIGTVSYDIGRRRTCCAAHDARGERSPAHAPRDGVQWLRRVRRRDLLARPRAEACGLPPFRRRACSPT